MLSDNIRGYVKVLEDDFENDLSDIYSTTLRRDVYASNSPTAVFLDGSETDASGNSLGLDPITVEEGVLKLGAGLVPADKLAATQALVSQAGQTSAAQNLKYYTGMVTTSDSWAQTYGYFEVVAKIPEGEGFWPAAWLTAASQGWPPEVDIFEAYGKGLTTPTYRDGKFNSAVFFDAIDANGNPGQNVDLTNPYDLDANGNPSAPLVKNLQGKPQYIFTETTTDDTYDVDIYEDFWTYGVDVTPEYITFYLGSTRETLQQIYRTPTPADLSSPLYMILNNQVGSNFGWNPLAGEESQLFAPGNEFQIDSLSIYARPGDTEILAAGAGALIHGQAGGTRITASAGDDIVVSGTGFDEIDLRYGADLVFVGSSKSNTILSGFGSDDRIVLSRWYLDGVDDALSRLTQVGDDVWLTKGAYPVDPQTVIFRDHDVADFSADDFTVRWSQTPDIWSSARISATRLINDGSNLVVAHPDGSKISDSGTAAPGAVTLRGSDNGDLYFVYRTGTIVLEDPDGGVDTLTAHRSVTLAANVENLTGGDNLSGAVVLTGNDMDNVVTSGIGAQTLAGAGGDDLIDLTKGTASRVLYGTGGGHDTLMDFDADDVLVLENIPFPDWAGLSTRLSQLGADVMLDLGSGQSVTFLDTELWSLGSANFSFLTGAMTITGEGADPWWRPNGSVSDLWLHERSALLDPYNQIHGSASGGTLQGTGGSDAIFAVSAGKTTLNGKGGRDLLFGGPGDDVLNGGDGNDRIEGGGGADKLYGNAGADTFVFSLAASGSADQIMDFSLPGGDTIDLSAFGNSYEDADIRITQRNSWVDIRWDGGEQSSAVIVKIGQATIADVTAALSWDGLFS